MKNVEYVSRKVLDRYMDRMTRRLERMYDDLQDLGNQAKSLNRRLLLIEQIAQASGKDPDC